MSTATAVTAVLRILVEHLRPGPNARGSIGDVTELAVSLKSLGQQEPILVTDLGDGRYQVLDGHRRLTAARKAKLPALDAVVRSDDGLAKRLLQQLAMHAHGKTFDPIAEAETLHTLMFEHNLAREEIARAVGRPSTWVRDRIALMHLEPGEREAVRTGRMSLAQAASTLAWRRAQRDGSEPLAATAAARSATRVPRTANPTANAHCPTCTCGQPARPRDDTCGDQRCVAYAIALDAAATRREDR